MLRLHRCKAVSTRKGQPGVSPHCHFESRVPHPCLQNKSLLPNQDYAADNGRGPGRTPEQKIRGRKLSTFEGGIRVPAIAWGPGLGVKDGLVTSEIVRAMDWYPTLATFAGIQVPERIVMDGRDVSPLLKGESDIVPLPSENTALNGSVPLRRTWNPPGEWASIIKREDSMSFGGGRNR